MWIEMVGVDGAFGAPSTITHLNGKGHSQQSHLR